VSSIKTCIGGEVNCISVTAVDVDWWRVFRDRANGWHVENAWQPLKCRIKIVKDIKNEVLAYIVTLLALGASSRVDLWCIVDVAFNWCAVREWHLL
jgi:hypothetical protein